MFFLQRPSAEVIERLITESRELPLSYGPVGLVQHSSKAFDVDKTAVVIGRGAADFERARAALATWKQFDVGWAELFPKNAPVETGTVVMLLVRHLGFWSLNGCRVVYRVGETDPDRRFGFAYGTLSNHSELGEEIFEVDFDPATDDVSYRIHAASRPRAALARLGYPIARLLQARFRRDSVKAMKRATR
ncbi:MAG TPA: DUF1990 domain-containing protein [Vicinamibacterales bacterium]|nr:DUF1990 domain-containing protein [Vicinamibacterales bacterium]